MHFLSTHSRTDYPGQTYIAGIRNLLEAEVLVSRLELYMFFFGFASIIVMNDKEIILTFFNRNHFMVCYVIRQLNAVSLRCGVIIMNDTYVT